MKRIYTLLVAVITTILFSAVLHPNTSKNVFALAAYGESCTKHTDCQYGMYCLTGGCFFQGCNANDNDCPDGLVCSMYEGRGYYCTYSLNSSSTTPTDPEPTPAPAPVEKQPKMASIANVSMPKSFTFKGSKTTDISVLTEAQSKKVKRFTLDIKGKGNIIWEESLDLSSSSLRNKFKNLNRFVIFKKGSVEVKADKIKPFANKKATVNMYNINLKLAKGETPVILRNSKVVSKGISKIIYKAKKNILSFQVNRFSKYTLIPSISIEKTPKETNETKVELNGSVDDLDSKVTVIIGKNTETVNIDKNGVFNYEVELNEGENIITVKAKGVSGAVSEKEIRITRVVQDNTPNPQSENTGMILIIAGIAGAIVIFSFIVFAIFIIKKKKKDADSNKETANTSSF